MKYTAFILMIITVISKFLGLFRERLLAIYFATGPVAEAFKIAMDLPIVIFGFITVGISTGFIPTFKRIEKNEGFNNANKFTSNLGNISLIISVFLVVICEVFAPQITKILAPKLSIESYELAIVFSRITYICIIAITVATVYRGYLYSMDNYLIPALQGFILNVIIIMGIVLGAKVNIYFLPVGLCLGNIIQYIIYIPAVKKTKFKWRPIIDFSDKYLKNMIYLSIPVVFGTSITQIGMVIDKALSTIFMPNGGYAIMGYASRLNDFVSGIVIVSLSTIAYTELSDASASDDIYKFKDTILSSISSINILVIPCSIGVMIFAKPIVNLVYNSGAWKNSDTLYTGEVLRYYAFGLVGMGITDILLKSFYSLKDTKTPTINALFMLFVDLFFSLLFANLIGLPGLALGTSLGTYFGSFTLVILIRKKIGKFKDKKKFLKENIKMLVSGLIMGLVSYGCFKYTSNYLGETSCLIISVLVAIVIYGLFMLILQVEEFSDILESFKRKYFKH